MIAKLIVHDTDRDAARRRMLRALEEFAIEGTPTLLGFHRALLEHPCFAAGETCHGLVESEELAQRREEMDELSHRTTNVRGRSDGTRTRSRLVAVEVDGRSFDVSLVTTEPAVGGARRGGDATGARGWAAPARAP